ncbi:D-arabinono-1,4-lactone oxidase [Aspergillus lucknowensis]|uniref:D-arabinono-1,4-lactone oxidase n=1 Tax=Aspergillus lucknowensis TaxID=176173 RepID=A0ABR4M5S3_9EURO
MDPTVLRELSRLDPTVPFRTFTGHIHHTWAQTFYSRPELYIRPQSITEIQKVVNLARRSRRRLVVVGSGHSPSDLTCTSAWMVSLDDFNRIIDVDTKTGIVTVEAGIRLRDLGALLDDKYGLMLSNLGSIDSQSIGGVFATGTHGSSLVHGLLSECIVSLTLMLANGQLVRCSTTNNQALFRAALISLGALGIVVEVSLRAEPSFKIAWKQVRRPLSSVLDEWSSGLWTSHEFVRVWWMPYQKSAIVWHADKTDRPLMAPPENFFGGALGYHIYHNLLALSNYFPRILPWVEWLVFGLQYGFRAEKTVSEAVEPARTGLLLNCLYSQFVNEWALPLEKGPEALTRLSAWLHGDYETARIPFPVENLWVHCPVEVRVTDTTRNKNPRPFLDPTSRDGPTLYLNATLYRPYHRDPPSKDRYYEAFEWLMREMGAKPHWAKNFKSTGQELRELYGGDMDEWLKVRHAVDAEGMFLGEWHYRTLALSGDERHSGLPSAEPASLSLMEREKARQRANLRGAGDGLEWIGDKRWKTETGVAAILSSTREEKHTSISPTTATSEESFDVLASGEASVIIPEP